MRWLLLVSVVLWGAPAAAQTVTDGDTIKMDGITYRLWGIDAPETKQDCADGWTAGHSTGRNCPASLDRAFAPNCRGDGSRRNPNGLKYRTA
ncbi:MAG: hypothetical protein JW395_1728 [Nitrospira sp.]|nr:hypothetical protein [Nitrospira sp.]